MHHVIKCITFNSVGPKWWALKLDLQLISGFKINWRSV